MTKKRLWEIAQEHGWVVAIDGEDQYLLSQYSSRGQDFNVSVNGHRVSDIIESLDSYLDSFDISYEAYLWLDDTGHGKNGAPYEMIDVYKDMEECKEMMEELVFAWKH